MRRLILIIAVALSLVAAPVSAAPRHHPAHSRVCHLLGIAITFGGDAGEPDIWIYFYRCTDGHRYERAVNQG